MLFDLGVGSQGGERVDEAEQPRPEVRVGDGRGEEAVAPPRQVEHPGAAVAAEIGDMARQGTDLDLRSRGLDGGHCPTVPVGVGSGRRQGADVAGGRPAVRNQGRCA